jgi:thymidine phosphorylase
MAALKTAVYFHGTTSAKARALTVAMRGSKEELEFPDDRRLSRTNTRPAA